MIMVPLGQKIHSQDLSSVEWIRPNSKNDKALWGIKGGIVIGLWPTAIENKRRGGAGGPRGLLRMGYEANGKIYKINFIAIEPVVDGRMGLSELAPSRIDGKKGKFMWASIDKEPGAFYPAANTRGEISHPYPDKPEVEVLSFYIFIEQFLNGAHPYLRVSIRSDKPDEIAFEIFNQDDSAPMERCVLTATMGNYARLRKLYLKDKIVDSRELYEGFNEIGFIKKEEYPIDVILKNDAGDFIAILETNESFAELSSWPQSPEYFERWTWRYRPYFKTIQYWRKEADQADESLRIKVNGRAAYWAGASKNKSDYIEIPGGPAFENFELREKYYPGQKFYFGITRRSVQEIIDTEK